jgi:hypoxanthine-guanine phosphoribosyltransferase
MAKSKTISTKDLNAYLFMSIQGKDVQVVYHDTIDNGLAIGAAFASLLEEDAKLFDIISAAMLTALEAKEKHSSKKSNKLPKTVKKEAKKK